MTRRFAVEVKTESGAAERYWPTDLVVVGKAALKQDSPEVNWVPVVENLDRVREMVEADQNLSVTVTEVWDRYPGSPVWRLPAFNLAGGDHAGGEEAGEPSKGAGEN